MEPLELEPGEAHVRRGDGEFSWCGVPLLFAEWTFVSPVHARILKEAKRERQPCPRCWAAIERCR